MGASDSRERILADSQFGGGSLGTAGLYAPATWYLGLSTNIPNEDGTGFVEPVGGSYARLAVTNSAANFPAATTAGGVTVKKNGIALTFINPTGLWGLIGYYGWFTASSGGTPEYTFPLDTPITVQNGNTPVQFDIGQLAMAFD